MKSEKIFSQMLGTHEKEVVLEQVLCYKKQFAGGIEIGFQIYFFQ